VIDIYAEPKLIHGCNRLQRPAGGKFFPERRRITSSSNRANPLAGRSFVPVGLRHSTLYAGDDGRRLVLTLAIFVSAILYSRVGHAGPKVPGGRTPRLAMSRDGHSLRFSAAKFQ
jgi:hypothetical protein